jgi:tRNA 2-selenouridine synthase
MAEFEALFLQDTPLIDVRAPIEFELGHFPTSISLPILNDEERKAVGTCYKEEGQEAAIRLGHELVSGLVKTGRVEAWLQAIKTHPEAQLYCFRGGLRSQISVQWISEAGIKINRVPGGYKALRNHLIARFEKLLSQRSFSILGGKTGSGKTSLLSHVGLPFLDLEHHANHKGSSFGAQGPQPAQATFENSIFISLLKTPDSSPVLIEDESAMVGSRVVPQALLTKMKAAPLYVLETPLEERVQTIAKDYVLKKLTLNPTQDALEFFLQGLQRISKKLGGLSTKRIQTLMMDSFSSAEVSQTETHALWIRELLVLYYDPLYERSLTRNRDRIACRGTAEELTSAFQSLKEGS